MRLFFVNINSIGVTPLMGYIVNHLNKYFKISIVESYIGNTTKFNNVKNLYIGKFKNSYCFNNQSRFYKLYKYFYVLTVLVFQLLTRRKKVFYTVDFQVLAFILFLKKVFKRKNWKVVYHQFELIDINRIGGFNRKFYNLMIKYATYCDLVILPEKNRLEILLQAMKLDATKSFYFPNINAITELAEQKHPVIDKLPFGSKIVGHIGSIGPDHYINNFIKAVSQPKFKDVFIIFVGKQDKEIKKLVSESKLENIIFIDEVPHYELKSIYSFLDLGFILYKGIDDNFEYCAPNKLYEYWAYGVPVIAHTLKGLSHEFNDHSMGKLIDMNSIHEIENSIVEYLETNKRDAIIRDFQNNYSMKDFLSDLLNKIQAI